jgi:hypothetical protein
VVFALAFSPHDITHHILSLLGFCNRFFPSTHTHLFLGSSPMSLSRFFISIFPLPLHLLQHRAIQFTRFSATASTIPQPCTYVPTLQFSPDLPRFRLQASSVHPRLVFCLTRGVLGYRRIYRTDMPSGYADVTPASAGPTAAPVKPRNTE